MEYLARSIEAVLSDAKVKRAVLVGHSMGTPVIRQFYRVFPEKTAGLVIVDGALRILFPEEQTDQFMTPLRTNYQAAATERPKEFDQGGTRISDEEQASQKVNGNVRYASACRPDQLRASRN